MLTDKQKSKRLKLIARAVRKLRKQRINAMKAAIRDMAPEYTLDENQDDDYDYI